MTATELLSAYRSGERSPVEATEACLAAIRDHDGELAAFCLTDPDAALASAGESEARWRRGTPAGLLDGVPVAVKDVFLTAGWPTRRGFPAVAEGASWDVDAPAVAALRRHGAVLVGKTTTPQLGWKGVTDGPHMPVTRNPWDPARTAGGSSGGSAAAVAKGMAPLALGTDGGGSIRIPGAFCGITGIKPTFARVPHWPPSPFGLLAHAGPMARTVADAALLLDVLAEPDAREWAALPPPPGRYSDALEGGIEGLRIAFSPDLGYVDVDPEVAPPSRRRGRSSRSARSSSARTPASRTPGRPSTSSGPPARRPRSPACLPVSVRCWTRAWRSAPSSAGGSRRACGSRPTAAGPRSAPTWAPSTSAGTFS